MTTIGRLATMLVVCSGLVAAPLQAQPIKPLEKASLEVVTDKTAYQSGSTAVLAAKLRIDNGWHTNSHEPTFDYLIATTLNVLPPPGWPPVTIDYPPGRLQQFAFADQPISVYEGEVVIIARLAIPEEIESQQWPIDVLLTYQACDDRSCLPPVTTETTVVINTGLDGVASTDPAFAPAPPAARPTAGSLPLMLVLGVLGGLILNAMPCVLPVLSLKIFGLVKSAGRGRVEVVMGSLVTSLGILLSFWALALAAILAKSAGAAVGWGIQFQEPIFVAILTLIVLLFCLNLWGVFEVPLPTRLAQWADSGPKHGLPGHLASGLFATLMATPCSAPFLGAAVGFALSQQALAIFAIFTAIAIGMALPYLALAAAPAAARFLPKPGAWMDSLRITMGFLLAGAAIWLLYVLAAQMSRERLAFIQLVLLALALFVWVHHRAGDRRAVRLTALLAAVLSIVALIALAAGADDDRAARLPGDGSTLIPWVAFDRPEAERLAAAGRLVFVDVTADWCFTCKVNERLVLETAPVEAAFRRFGVVPMKADWTNRDPAIAEFLADHGRYGIPFYLLYRPGKGPHLFGELLTVEEVISTLQAAAAGASVEVR